jgi:hypothetical protein
LYNYPEDVLEDIKDMDSPRNRELEDKQNYEESKGLIEENEELGVLISFKDQLQKMIDYFSSKEKDKDFQYFAEQLDVIRCDISQIVAKAEGWLMEESN